MVPGQQLLFSIIFEIFNYVIIPNTMIRRSTQKQYKYWRAFGAHADDINCTINTLKSAVLGH